MKQYIELLKNKNLALIFWGQWISNLGNSINTLGLSWFILNFNGQISDLSILLLFKFLPSVIIGPIAGTIVDRIPKKIVIILSDIIQGFLSLLLIVSNTLPLIYCIVFLQSVVSVFFSPAIRSLLPQIVDKEDLPTANALNGISNRVSMLAGPMIGGLLLGFADARLLFLINGISFFCSAFSEAFIKYEDISSKQDKVKTTLIQDFKAGFDYILRKKMILFVITFFAVMSLTGGGWRTLYTSYLKLELKVIPQVFGILMTTMGTGSLMGAFIVGKINNKVSSLSMMLFGFLFYAISFILMGWLSNVLVLGLIFFLCGTFLQFLVLDMTYIFKQTLTMK